METRKIQKIGGSSFSLVLPKKWVVAHRLKNKDGINIGLQRSGQLVLSPQTKKITHRKTISIEGLEGEELYREVIVLYILGWEEIELRAAQITLGQRKTVRQVIAKLAGLETLEESSIHILLKSFLDPSKFVFSEYLSKIFLMSRLMFTDALNAFLRSNKELAADVAERDFEIDKIDFLISRMKHSLMLGSLTEEELRASIVEADYYENIAKQLERVADHAVKIAQLTQTSPKPESPKLEKVLRNAAEQIIILLQDAENFAKVPNKKAANKTLLEISKIDLHGKGVYEEMVKIGYAPALILSDSLDRITGYIVNMAEYTLAQGTIEKVQ